MKKRTIAHKLGLLTATVFLSGVLSTTSAFAESTQESALNTIGTSVKNERTAINLKQTEAVKEFRDSKTFNSFGPSDNQSTGVYKQTGDTIIIYVDESTDQQAMPTYRISPTVLNHFSTDGNSAKIPLKKGKNIINNTSKGLIHLQNVSSTTNQGKLSITIEGGEKIPRFISGKTTQAEWETQVKENPNASGYEFVGEHVLITGGNSTLKMSKNPQAALTHHDKIVEVENQTAGLDNSKSAHQKPRNLVQHMRETNQSGYYMYAYYNHTAYSTSSGMNILLNPTSSNLWGPAHEIGHTYQSNKMNFGNLTEVTNNIYSMRVQKAFGGSSRLESDNTYQKAFNYIASANKDYNNQTDPFLKLVMFWQLELAFGSDFYPNLHKLQREENKSLSSNSVKQQYFITSASKVANKNLAPFFEKWGLSMTTETKSALAKYPTLTEKIWEYRDKTHGGDKPVETKPEAPTNVVGKALSPTSIQLNWSTAISAAPIKEYIIYRNNQEVVRTTSITHIDSSVSANTSYDYQIAAVDTNGNISPKSTNVNVMTPQIPVEEVMTKPTNLKTLETTTKSVRFSWEDSNKESNNYRIYRNNTLLTTISATSKNFSDNNLTAGTEYRYQVSAVNSQGKESPKSDVLIAKTSNEPVNTGTWETSKVYVAGDKVTYNGGTYEAKWWTQNNRPDISDAWKRLDSAISEWNTQKAYVAGEKATYNGTTYEAKWWTKNNRPDSSTAWKRI